MAASPRRKRNLPPRRGSHRRPSEISLHLAVGPFDSAGHPLRAVEYQGQQLAQHTSEGTRAVWSVGSRSSLRVERTLYEISNEDRFAVHSVLRSGTDRHPVLAKVEIFPDWSGVSRAHPDLARIAHHHPPSPPGDSLPSPSVPRKPSRQAPGAPVS